jgi:hypothetical protein
MFYENFACGAERNYTNYCNRELKKGFDRQSTEPDNREAQAPGVGDRQEIAVGRRTLPQPRRLLLVPAGEGCHNHFQRHL